MNDAPPESRRRPSRASGFGIPVDAEPEERIEALSRQVERLSQETLDLYRQVNLLYRIGDSISACLGTEEICLLVLRESVKILRARSGIIRLADGAVFGRSPEEPRTTLSVPIETAQRRLGEVTVFDKRDGFFTAADEKLIRAVARQAGIAMENNRLISGLIHQNEELERLNRELRALDQMKSDFVSNVSHELRTPLASIKGFAATILDDEEMPPEIVREFVGIIDDESDKLIVIINDILDVSKMLGGHMSYDLRQRPLERTLESVVTLLGIQADQKGLELSLEVVDAAAPWFDETRMSQVFTNLVGNAIKFTDEGAIRVRQWVADGRVHVSVTDTGIGIEPAALPQIFDKFYRVENVVHTKEGTGLGLALVRGILEHHRGSVEVASAPGQGSVFTVHLPLDPPPLEPGPDDEGR